jgi:hypothetical protein
MTRTRQRRAKCATCDFQIRECTIDHVGRKKIVGSPCPKTSQYSFTPSLVVYP